jgi:hypothetical protein
VVRAAVVGALAFVLGSSAACGRIAFDPFAGGADPDASQGDADGDAAGPACDLAAPFGAPVLIAELSDPADFDGTLRLLPDELSGYFWSRSGRPDNDIFLATRPDRSTPFSITPVSGINTDSNELDPTISSDGSVLVFRRSGPGDDLYVATRVAPDAFTDPVAIATIDTAEGENQGFMPIGRDELYYQHRTGTGADIYFSKRDGTTFSAPTVVSELAAADEEGDPVVTPDGLTIYFRSDRPAAFGGFNVYTASRSTDTEPFGPVTMVPNVNTDKDDGPSWISPDGCRLYISSDAAGTHDIYVASRPL